MSHTRLLLASTLAPFACTVVHDVVLAELHLPDPPPDPVASHVPFDPALHAAGTTAAGIPLGRGSWASQPTTTSRGACAGWHEGGTGGSQATSPEECAAWRGGCGEVARAGTACGVAGCALHGRWVRECSRLGGWYPIDGTSNPLLALTAVRMRAVCGRAQGRERRGDGGVGVEGKGGLFASVMSRPALPMRRDTPD